MAIGNINAKIVNRMTKNLMCVVDFQSKHPFMVACLLNAVSLRGNACIKIELLMQTLRFYNDNRIIQLFRLLPSLDDNRMV